MENRIIFELCAEDRARLDAIIEALTKTSAAGAANIAQEAPKAAAKETHAPAEEKPAAEEKPQPAPTVRREDIQQKIVQLVQAGKKAEVRNTVAPYGDRVSAFPEEQLDEIWQRLTALEG